MDSYPIKNRKSNQGLSFGLKGSTYKKLCFFFSAAILVSTGIISYFLWSEVALSNMTIEEAENIWKRNSHSPAIVSMTTLPSRFERIYTVVNNMLTQTIGPKEIHIQVPEYSFREKMNYTTPTFLHHKLAIKVQKTDKDYGPATKFIPAILRENPDQKIIIVDDDTLYSQQMVETLTKYSDLYPEAVVALRGWDVAPSLRWKDSKVIYGKDLNEPRRVDVVTGCGAILIKPKFFDKDVLTNYLAVPKEAFFVDDIWLSGNLARRNIPRYVIPVNRNYQTMILRSLWYDENGLIDNENKGGKNNDVMLDYFKDSWGNHHQQ